MLLPSDGSGISRSFARIKLEKSSDESLDLAVNSLLKIKTQQMALDEKLHMIKGEIKLGFKDRYNYHEFFILTRPNGKHSVIDIWFSHFDLVNGPIEDTFIRPFYENMCNLTSSHPEFIIDISTFTDKEIEKLANIPIS